MKIGHFCAMRLQSTTSIFLQHQNLCNQRKLSMLNHTLTITWVHENLSDTYATKEENSHIQRTFRYKAWQSWPSWKTGTAILNSTTDARYSSRCSFRVYSSTRLRAALQPCITSYWTPYSTGRCKEWRLSLNKIKWKEKASRRVDWKR